MARWREQSLFRSPLMATRTRSIYVARIARNCARRSVHSPTTRAGQLLADGAVRPGRVLAANAARRSGNGRASADIRSASAVVFQATSSPSTRLRTNPRFLLVIAGSASLAQADAHPASDSGLTRRCPRLAVPDAADDRPDLRTSAQAAGGTPIGAISADTGGISAVPSAAPRSLVAYQGTVSPHHRLDEGERPSSGEGLDGVRWAASERGLAQPAFPRLRASARQGRGQRGRCPVAR